MTPVQGWTEDAYFRASRAARRAFDRTSSQLQFGLDREDVTRADDPGCDVLPVEPVLPHSPLAAGSTSKQSRGGGASSHAGDARRLPEGV